jgi:hypothetical protein
MCSASDSVKWRSQATNEIIYQIGSENTTAAVWLNFVDHGATDLAAPQSGDVICCKVVAAQHADVYADIQSNDCAIVP